MLGKMDALLKKHRGSSTDSVESPDHAAAVEPASAPAPNAIPEHHTPPAAHAHPPGDAWLPVLTDVIERGTPPAAIAATPAAVTLPIQTDQPDAAAQAAPAPIQTESDVLAEQLMRELGPRLSEVMEKQLAVALRRGLDQTVASLLSQLDVNVREIVREAVAEKLNQPRDPSI
jgi:hypothetical protein